MSALARLSLAHRGLVALVTLIVLGFGAFTIPQLRQQMFPPLSLPMAVVTAQLPGAPPEVVAQQVATPIEAAVASVRGAETVTSVSRDGYATVQVEFDYGEPIDDMVNRVQSAVAGIAGQLPDGSDPRVLAGSFDNVPIMHVSASGTDDPRAFTERLRRLVVPKVQGVDGVRGVEVVGGTTDHVAVTLDPAKAAAAGVGTDAVAEALRANGSTVPAGTLTQPTESLAIQVGGALRTVDDVRNLFVTAEGPRGEPASVRLGSVATVDLVPDEITSLTRVDGRPSVGLSVLMRADGDAVSISHDIRALLPTLQGDLGGDAKLIVTSDTAPEIEASVEGLTTEGLLGLAFAVIVILVFLMSLRSTLVTAVSIPVSVVTALIALWVWDYSLNLLTLGALTIAVGRVVDDSIVVLENIKRHLGYGTPKRDAVLVGVREVTGAVVASTLTTVAVFLPIAFVGGFIGQIFGPFAVTVSVALLASLLVALTIVPVLAFWFLRPPAGATSPEERERVRLAATERERRNWLQRAYVPVIGFATRRRATTLTVAVLLFAGTAGLATRLQTNLLDQSDTTTITVSQKMPPGTSLAATDAAATTVEKILAGYPEVAIRQVTIGATDNFGFGEATNGGEADFTVTVKKGTDLSAFTKKVRDRLTTTSGIGTVVVAVGDSATDGGIGSGTLEVVVRSTDPATLAQAAEQVRTAMAGTPKVINVASNLAASAPRVDIAVDRQAAARYGLTDTAIGEIVATVYRGAVLTTATIDGRPRDVVLRTGAAPADLDALRALPVPTPAGPVRLDALANVRRVDGPTQITHIDGARTASITGTPDTTDTGAVTADLEKRLTALTLPTGATYSIGGVSAEQDEAFGNLGLTLAAAIALVFLIMAATFRSIVQPLILLVSVPFAAIGAVILLLLTGTALGLPALIGMLMLVGIVVTNAIVLMDLINQYRARGMGIHEAVVEGGRKRLRPILMTAVATICALSPMAFGVTDSGGFISQPLAIVVIGGLISSTLLTLVVVPTLYTIVEGVSERLAARRAQVPDVSEPEPAMSGSRR